MRRRFTLGIGAALLVGRWEAMRHDVATLITLVTGIRTGEISIIITMAVGAGLLVFAAARPTTCNDE